jgi:hypothetical protein
VEPGRLDLRLGVSLSGASTGHLAECPDLGPECGAPVPPTPYYHHVDLVLGETSLDASYGVTRWLAAELRFSVRVVDLTPTYSEIDGREKLVPDDIHHHDVTIIGPTDPWVSLRFAGTVGKLVSAAKLGVTLPLGGIEPDPYKLGAEGKSHEHTQLGTGTLMPLVGIGLSYNLDPVELSVSGTGLFSVYENRVGFRAPSRYFFSARATLRLLDGALRPYVELDIPHETQELWNGSPGLEGSNVRTDLLVGGGLTWEFAEPWAVEAGFMARAAQLTHAATFDYPGVGQLALSTRFDLGGERRP